MNDYYQTYGWKTSAQLDVSIFLETSVCVVAVARLAKVDCNHYYHRYYYCHGGLTLAPPENNLQAVIIIPKTRKIRWIRSTNGSRHAGTVFPGSHTDGILLTTPTLAS